jgi:hypothetical protein
MKDGTAIHAHGQWWDGHHQENAPEPIVQVGIGTLENLTRCYVYSGGRVSKKKLDAWLASNASSSDYYKYDKRSEVNNAMDKNADEIYHTRCNDCGRWLKRDLWVRKDHPRKKHALCAVCLSSYDGPET